MYFGQHFQVYSLLLNYREKLSGCMILCFVIHYSARHITGVIVREMSP